MKQRLTYSALILCMSAMAAFGASVSEADFGGDFSGDWKNPTMISSGNTQISGVWSGGNDYDLIGFTGLAQGVQSLVFEFTPLTPIGDKDYSFSAGGELKYQFYKPEYSAWEGETFGKVKMTYSNRKESFIYTLALDEDFAGTLYLGLYNTHGTLQYNISAAGNGGASSSGPGEVSSVPAPAPLALLISACAALGFMRKRKLASKV